MWRKSGLGHAAWLPAILCATQAFGEITESQVLVVYNSASPEAEPLLDTYLSAHPGIPQENLLDLNNPALLVADLTQAQFVSLVRNPVRNYLLQAGAPQPEDIIAMALIRPFPHRVLDSDNPSVGDAPTSAQTEEAGGDATYASLDAELVLLWQELYTGEAGGRMDSRSDNTMDNPYHTSTSPIHTFSRAAIQTVKTFNNTSNLIWTLGGSGATRLTAGDMYLVCRIDGSSLAQAQALVERTRNIRVNKSAAKTVLDEYNLSVAQDLDDDRRLSSGDPFLAGDDYEETRDALLANGWLVRYDATADFITGLEEPAPLIAYASYGENHSAFGGGESPPGSGTYVDDFCFAPGAVFNTLESYNARAFNGLAPMFGQEQVADFAANGGTFAVGYVFEPFTFSIVDNEFLFTNMMVRQMRWAEAAYSAIPALSWQVLVLGDPLGRIDTVYQGPADCDADGTSDLCQLAGNDCNVNGYHDACDVASGTSADADASGVPDECENTAPAATMLTAGSRKLHGGGGGVQDVPLNLAAHVQNGDLSTESRQGGITELRVMFNVSPGAPGAAPVTVLKQVCPGGTQAAYAPYTGTSAVSASVSGAELVLSFAPGLESAGTYKVILGPELSSLAGQSLELRSLTADANGDGQVNGSDRSTIVGAWTGPGYSMSTDLDLNGVTNGVDRSVVVGAWTSGQNCAP